ncbi:MAG: asparagine synthase (glutamine-hydrolyzing) [Gemmatimonadetes bacterium]|nr:MAG: asparagine synthase (glutamine-hydrolyzing) [Gemmatimonadota bacterium]
MCGIAGAAALRAGATPNRDRVRRMSCRLAHRGPDASGWWEAPSGRAVVAHRRLSVIDLATGQQPMVDPEQQVCLTFNGEIYNYKELRKKLADDGVEFRTESDTEVILQLYRRKGAACVDELRGMFAFAVWDDAKGQLLLARDRIGKKPLFYTLDDSCLYFASSLRALRETSDTHWEIDLTSVDAYLTLSYIPAPRTIYEGVSKLEAGTVATIASRSISTRRYWDLACEIEPAPPTMTAAVDRLDEILNAAVALRLRSDVPLGVFLSGGVDSSLVAAVAARQAGVPIKTFSMGFDVAAFDETGFASEVARRLGTEHQIFRAKPDLLGTLPAMVRHFGEPFADSSALPTWVLSEETRKHVTVALAGDGGDEGFAGYAWYRTARRLGKLTSVVPERVFGMAGYMFDGIARGPVRRVALASRLQRGMHMLGVKTGSDRFATLRSFIGRAEARLLYDGALREARMSDLGASGERLAQLYQRCEGSDLRRARYVDIASYLADCLMPKVDVASMAHGLEARAPLLDQELIRFGLSLPDEWLLAPDGGKKILRAVLARYLPASLFDRPKQGFSVPLRTWFRGSERNLASSVVTSERLRATGWFKSDGMGALVNEHLTGIRDHSQRLFSFLVLDEWLKYS